MRPGVEELLALACAVCLPARLLCAGRACARVLRAHAVQRRAQCLEGVQGQRCPRTDASPTHRQARAFRPVAFAPRWVVARYATARGVAVDAGLRSLVVGYKVLTATISRRSRAHSDESVPRSQDIGYLPCRGGVSIETRGSLAWGRTRRRDTCGRDNAEGGKGCREMLRARQLYTGAVPSQKLRARRIPNSIPRAHDCASESPRSL